LAIGGHLEKKMSEEKDTAIYKPDRCYRCGGQMGLFSLKDTWKMRVGGDLHEVPVFAIPCLKCLECGNTVLNGWSDEPVMWCLNRYLDRQGLNTWQHKAWRWVRRRIESCIDRYNYWVYKTFCR